MRRGEVSRESPGDFFIGNTSRQAAEAAMISAGTHSQGNPESVVVDDVLRAGVACVSTPPALVLQTDEGDTTNGSTTGFVVGDIAILSDGVCVASSCKPEEYQAPEQEKLIDTHLMPPL